MEKIIENLCYTELVYQRINKKLKLNLSKKEIEEMILKAITSKHSELLKIGKNYYIQNYKMNLKITVNSSTYRVITIDKLIQKERNNT